MIHPKVTEAIDEIDAAVWSGDTFLDADNRKLLRDTMERWERGLKEAQEIDENEAT